MHANPQDSEGLKNVADPLSECLTDEVETTVKDAIKVSAEHTEKNNHTHSLSDIPMKK